MTGSDRLLVDCLHRDASRLEPSRLERLTDRDWDGLLAAAARHRVRPPLFTRLTAAGVRDLVPPRTRDALRGSCAAIARRTLQLHAELLRLLERFDAAGIPVIPLKGMHLASVVYGDVARREVRDLDLLVPLEDIRRAAALVVDAGYAPAKPLDIASDVEVHNHIGVLVNASRVVVELHWNLTLPRLPGAIDPAVLWSNAEPVEIFGHRTRALCRHHLLLHICRHMAAQHQFEFGLQPLCDVAALIDVQRDALDWGLLRRQAEEWRWLSSVSLVLRLARDLIGVPVPREAVAAFELDRPAGDVVNAAIEMTMTGGHHTVVPPRRMGALDSPGARGRIKYLVSVVAATPEDLRHIYPQVPRVRAIWWIVYVLRGAGLVRRYLVTLGRLFVFRETGLRTTLAHQRRLEHFLSSGR